MATKSRNLISLMACEAVEQWLVCKTSKGNDFDREIKRLEACKMACESVAKMAEQQIEVLRNTGFIPDDNILIDQDEVKLVNAKRNLTVENRKKSVNLLDEFVKK